MTVTMTSLEIAQTTDRREAMACIYTDSEMMLAWLAAPKSMRDKLARAEGCLATASDMRGRFGVDNVPADVLVAIRAFVAAARAAVAPCEREVRALRAKGYSWGEVWNLALVSTEFGFSTGDAALLGCADAEIDTARARALAFGTAE